MTIITHDKKINVGAGKYIKTTGLDYKFSIKSKTGNSAYEAKDIPLTHVHWTGWGPFSKRMFYVQLEADGKLWVLRAKTQVPVTNFIEQPDGFPLEPNT